MAASDRDSGDGGRLRPPGAPSLDAPGTLNPVDPLSEMPTMLGPLSGAQTIDRSLPAHTPVPGERFGEKDRFEIVGRLGLGGMGHVFRAVDRYLDRAVAIKFILQTGQLPLKQLVAMLRQEAKATAKLNHENIVAIYDIDLYQEIPFLVMELLDGQSLDVILDRSRIGPLRATQIMTQVARGLAHAHANGILHRDLKPSNVFILRDGRAKILDFGISALEPVVTPAQMDDRAPGITSYGTPEFMPPEQLRAESHDARADIWAAGVMFYQALTGRLPYTVPELLRKFRGDERFQVLAPSVRQLVPTLPEEADRLVATALSEDPAGRFQTAGEMAEALRELEGILGNRSSEGQASVSAQHLERRPLTIAACHLEAPDWPDLDEVLEVDQRFSYQAATDTVKQVDGCIGTPVGGSFVCCFGYPVVKGNDAQRAVWAALQIAQAVRERAQQEGRSIDFRVGVHSGIVGLPSLPATAHGFPAMQGNVPNVALRLAEAAATGSVVISQATFELTRGLFHTQPLDGSTGTSDKGRAPVHQVLGEAESSGRFEEASAGQLTSFLGRDTELAFLQQLWSETKEGGGRIVVVSGEPGIGKSRLVQTLKDAVIEEHNIRLTCQCRPHFKNTAFHPLIDLILRSMDIHRADPPEQKLTKVENTLAALKFPLEETVPLFAALLSISFEPRYPSLGLAPEQQKMKTLESLVSMLLRMALNRPTLFIIEDMHWVDHSTIEFLNALIDRLPSSRVLVVLTSRAEFRAPWSARRHLYQLTLERLTPTSTLSMIEEVSKHKRLSADIIERLVAITDGVPLFIEELARMVVDSCQPTDAGSIAIPDTLHELLAAKLDLLRGIGKEVAQVASVLGRDFHYELLRHVSPFDEMSLQRGLEILADAGILRYQGRPPDSKYLFKHALVQQAAYQSLAKSERQRHHRRAAQVLTEVFKETADFQPELLAYHHGEAGNAREAIEFWETAGQRATQRSALVEAIHHYTRAREVLSTQPANLERDRKELGLLLAVGSPLMSVHGYASAEVEQIYARASQLARKGGIEADIFPAMQGLWQYYYVRGMLPTARQLGDQLLAIARESANPTFLLLAHRAIASSAFLQGDYDTCRAHAQAGFDIYDIRDHGSLALRTGHDPGVAHGVYLAWALWMLGYADQSLARVVEAVDLARRLAHPMTIAYALCFAALIRNHRGDHAEAKTLSEAALDITVPNKFALWTAWAKLQRGWGMAGTKDYERGIPLMQEGLEDWRTTGARVGFTFFPVTLAEMCLYAGHYTESERLLEDAAPMIGANDEHFYEPELLRLKGELCLVLRGGGDDAADAATASFSRGTDVARALSGKSWELRLATSRARLLASRGAVAEAADILRATRAWFTEGFDTADLRAASTELARLEAAAPR
jgi:TOMM system kinase/cyclase fusion protein